MQRLLPVGILLVLLLGACASGTATVSRPPEPATGADTAAHTEQAADPADLAAPLPLDPNVRIDTLENGIVYYIRVNDEPENRAELRLVVDAGAVLEGEAELGLAHFVEHMLFNGTCRFPEQELVSFLERTGMRFGPDINAYTSLDETVYMLQVPTDSVDLMKKSFEVLEDWATCATMSDVEIDKERGVVAEELRLRRESASGRISHELYHILLPNSRYADRITDDPTIVLNASYETVRDFYETWYRPDLMSVVAVGDFDADEIQRSIHAHFAHIPAPDEPTDRPSFDAPGHDGIIYRVLSDPELTQNAVFLYFTRERRIRSRVRDSREALVRGLFSGMLNQRLAEIARRPDAPFLAASFSGGSIVRPSEFVSLGAAVHEDSILVGLESVITEAERVRRHGFTEAELDRQRRETLRAFQRAYNERNNTNSASYADEYVSHFLESEPIPGIEYEYALARHHLPDISIEEVNAVAEELLSPESRAVFVRMVEREGLSQPTEAELASVFDVIAEKIVEPYLEDVSDAPLVEVVPEPAQVVEEQEIPEVGVQEFTLENGVRVVLKVTDFKQDEVRFTAFSPGGASLVDDVDHLEAQLATSVVNQSGVGAFDRTNLEKMLAGKVVNVSPYIGSTSEGFSGSASPEDLETLFQLVYLYVTSPRADSSAMAMLKNQYRASLMNRSADPNAAFQDTLQMALYEPHPRNFIFTADMVDEISLERAYEIYNERFEDVGDFTFIFVGNFDPEEVRSLSQRYLGNLPSSGRAEVWRDVFPELSRGVTERTVYRGIGDQSRVSIVFSGPFSYDREHRHLIRSLDEVLTILLREELREELGGTYGVSVNANPQDRPEERYTFTISFSTGPERVEELTEAVWRVIDRLKEEGPPEVEVEKVREQQRRGRETDMRTNPFWVSVLDFYYARDAEDVRDVHTYIEMTNALSADALRDAARMYLDPENYVKVILYPESRSGTGGSN